MTDKLQLSFKKKNRFAVNGTERRMPKVLLIPEFGPSGGTRTYFKTLLEFYAEQKYEVNIALTKDQADEETRLLIERLGFRYSLIENYPDRICKRSYRFPFNMFLDIWWLYPLYRSQKPNLIVVSRSEEHTSELQSPLN